MQLRSVSYLYVKCNNHSLPTAEHNHGLAPGASVSTWPPKKGRQTSILVLSTAAVTCCYSSTWSVISAGEERQEQEKKSHSKRTKLVNPGMWE